MWSSGQSIEKSTNKVLSLMIKFEQNGKAAAASTEDSNGVTIGEHLIRSQMWPKNAPIYVTKYLVEGV